MTCLRMLFDSGGTDTRLAHNAAAAWPPLREPRGLLQGTFEAQSHGFQARCLRFAVRVSPTPRKTRFRPLARRYRAGFSPAGSQRKVSATHACSHPPFAGLTWREPLPFSCLVDLVSREALDAVENLAQVPATVTFGQRLGEDMNMRE